MRFLASNATKHAMNAVDHSRLIVPFATPPHQSTEPLHRHLQAPSPAIAYLTTSKTPTTMIPARYVISHALNAVPVQTTTAQAAKALPFEDSLAQPVLAIRITSVME